MLLQMNSKKVIITVCLLVFVIVLVGAFFKATGVRQMKQKVEVATYLNGEIVEVNTKNKTVTINVTYDGIAKVDNRKKMTFLIDKSTKYKGIKAFENIEVGANVYMKYGMILGPRNSNSKEEYTITVGGPETGAEHSLLCYYAVSIEVLKPAQVLKIRVVKLDWDGIAAGTKVTLPDNSESTITSDLVGVKLSLEIRNTSSSPTRLTSAPYIGTFDNKVIFKQLYMPLYGFSHFPDDGVVFGGGETKVLEFESSMECYEEVKAAGDLFVIHDRYDDWGEGLSPLPARDVVYKKKGSLK